MDPATARLEALLAPLTNWERRRPDRPHWSLAGMRGMLERGEARVPAGLRIQVGGSKGKGTTAMYLEAFGKALGWRTGTYLSPHVSSLLERVRIDGREANAEELLAALGDVVAGPYARSGELSFFEAMTAAALNCFTAGAAELAVFEVGLGGRLDATTAIPVHASILTMVELEHTELLGDTVEKIAAEKAPILRPGGTAFTGAQGGALEVLRAHAREAGCRLAVLGEDFALEDVQDLGDGYRGVLRLGERREPFALPGACRFELPAFALAAACLATLRPSVGLPLLPAPRPTVRGRFELVATGDRWPLVLDGAHTESSLAAVADEVRRRWPDEPLALLFASASGKRWRQGLPHLLPRLRAAAATTVEGIPGEDPTVIRDWLAARGVPALTAVGPAAGLRWLLQQPCPRLVTGSFYLVGAVYGVQRHAAD
jgi:dihydrofolate synthase/folylpolyglutamate synthase